MFQNQFKFHNMEVSVKFKENLIFYMKRNRFLFKNKYTIEKYNLMENYKRVLPVGETIHKNHRFIFRKNIFWHSFFLAFAISFNLARYKFDYNYRYKKMVNYPDTFISIESNIDKFIYKYNKFTKKFHFTNYIDEQNNIRFKLFFDNENKIDKTEINKKLLNQVNEIKTNKKIDNIINKYINNNFN